MIYEYIDPWWKNIDMGNLKKLEKNFSQCHFDSDKNLNISTDPTWTDPGMNPGLHSIHVHPPISASLAHVCTLSLHCFGGLPLLGLSNFSLVHSVFICLAS
jgi:hypothetical protein